MIAPMGAPERSFHESNAASGAERGASPAYFSGNVAVNAVPSACVLEAVNVPPCSSAMARAMASPRPCPPAPPVRALSAR